MKAKKKKFRFKNNGIPCSVQFKAPAKEDKCIGITVFPEISILIDPKLTPKMTGNVLVHELAHAFFPHLSEKEVNRFGNTFIKLLYEADYCIKKKN